MKLKAAMLGVALAISPAYAKPQPAPFQRTPLVEQRVDSEGVFLLFETLKPVRNSIANYIIANEKMGMNVCYNLADWTFIARLHSHQSQAAAASWKFVLQVEGFSEEERNIMWAVMSNNNILLDRFSVYVERLSSFFDSPEFYEASSRILNVAGEISGDVESLRLRLQSANGRGSPDEYASLSREVSVFANAVEHLSELTAKLWKPFSEDPKLLMERLHRKPFNGFKCNLD